MCSSKKLESEIRSWNQALNPSMPIWDVAPSNILAAAPTPSKNLVLENIHTHVEREKIVSTYFSYPHMAHLIATILLTAVLDPLIILKQILDIA